MSIQTRTQIENKLNTLQAQARRIQHEQHLLITSRRNAARFGDLERQLEGPGGIWNQVDALRTQLLNATQ